MDYGNRFLHTYAMDLIQARLEEAAHERRVAGLAPRGALRRAAGSALIRLGLRLHPAAGEGLQTRPLRHADARR